MTQYLTPILRSQFTLFYRFSKTYIPKSYLIPFNGEWDSEVNTRLAETFKITTPFKYDEEYIILLVEKPEISEDVILEFDIYDVCAIYPLSEQAKQSISIKIDERIRLEPPIPQKVLNTIERRIVEQEMHKAFEAIWKIFDINTPLEQAIRTIKMDEVVQGLELRRQGVKAKQAKREGYYSFLIAYDRHAFFPKNKLGYFYDAGEVYAYYREKSSFEGSSIHNLLESIKTKSHEPSFSTIVRELKASEHSKDYIEQTTDENLRKYIVAPMYLMFKEELRSIDDIRETEAFKGKDKIKDFKAEFEAALLLIGAFFGYEKFYDAYYDSIGLKFYKESKKMLVSCADTEEVNLTNSGSKEMTQKDKIANENLDIKENIDEIVDYPSDETSDNFDLPDIIRPFLLEKDYTITGLQKKLKKDLKSAYSTEVLLDAINKLGVLPKDCKNGPKYTLKSKLKRQYKKGSKKQAIQLELPDEETVINATPLTQDNV